MKFPSSLVKFPLLVMCLMVAATMPVLAAGDDWRPVDPKELALKAPVVERDADAEALLWEVRVDDGAPGELAFHHYLRIKVFTERGREAHSKIDIPFGKATGGAEIKIRDIAARTIKPDGSIVELKKEDVFERDIIKASGLKLKAKSFALPGLEPGSIIEYRWREVISPAWANYVRLHFQRSIPVQTVRYYIKPYPFEMLGMRAQVFHGSLPPFVKEKGGFYSATMTNMPAFREEPRMPPEDQVRTWMLIYYSADDKIDPQKYWKDLGKSKYEQFKSRMKPNDEVKKTALSVVGDAATPEQKLERLFTFVRTKIKNVSSDVSGLSVDEILKLKANKSPGDTLKRGVGDGEDIDMLFAALATAAGFEARPILLSSRGDIFFDPAFPNSYFLHATDVAIKVGDQWRFYNPGYRYAPIGMLIWQEEGQDALITDPKEPVWVKTPMTPAEKSLVKRTAKLTLSDDGTLEGDVEIEYTGQHAIERKEENDDESPARREELLTNEIKRQMSLAELTNISIENVTDPDKPFTYKYHVKVPGYAERTGKRLFLRPAFFQYGIGPMFPTSDRENLVYFHYPWSEQDSVEITLPQGYDLDNADVPTPIGAGKVSQYAVRMAVTEDKRTLIYNRTFTFGTPEIILFPKTTYPALKDYFDQLNKADNHTITLKQGTARAAASQ